MPDMDSFEERYDDPEVHRELHLEARKKLLSPEVREAMERDAESLRESMKEEMLALDLDAWRKKNRAQQEKARQEIVEALPPPGYIWVQQSFKIVMCTLCGTTTYIGKDTFNGVELHNLWHEQIRQMYKALRIRGWVA